jgi:hypothetical protein
MAAETQVMKIDVRRSLSSLPVNGPRSNFAIDFYLLKATIATGRTCGHVTATERLRHQSSVFMLPIVSLLRPYPVRRAYIYGLSTAYLWRVKVDQILQSGIAEVSRHTDVCIAQLFLVGRLI